MLSAKMAYKSNMGIIMRLIEYGPQTLQLPDGWSEKITALCKKGNAWGIIMIMAQGTWATSGYLPRWLSICC